MAVRSLINGLHSRYNRAVVEQAAITGALNPEIAANPARASDMAAAVAARLDVIARAFLELFQLWRHLDAELADDLRARAPLHRPNVTGAPRAI